MKSSYDAWWFWKPPIDWPSKRVPAECYKSIPLQAKCMTGLENPSWLGSGLQAPFKSQEHLKRIKALKQAQRNAFSTVQPTQSGTAPLCVQLYTAAPQPHHGPIRFARWDQEPPPSRASDKGSWPSDTGRGLSAYFRTIDPNCTFLDWRAPFSCGLFALGILIRDWRIQIIQMFHRLELTLDAKGTRWFIKLLDKSCTLSDSRVIASRVARLLCTGNSTFQLVL